MNRPLGCCGFFLCSGFFAISGVWIFEFCFAFVVMSARPMFFFAWGHFVMNRPLALGFLCFLLVFGVFSRYPAFGFFSSASRLFLMSALNAPYVYFARGHFVMNCPLGFCGFFLWLGSFRDIQRLDF